MLTILNGLFLILFSIENFITLDPDFGWHLRMGQIISSAGIPLTDPLSYTMPSYPYVDHEWLTNIFLFKLYPVIGKLGLSFLYASLALASLNLLIKRNLRRWAIAPLILSATILLPFLGIRPQIQTWLLFALLLKIILDPSLWQRFRILLPLYFTLWANLHAGFASGIVLLAMYLILRTWQDKKIAAKDLLIFIFSILATFVNPYGARIWWEVWMTISDYNLHRSIIEWAPTVFKVDFAYLTLVALSSVLVLRFKSYLNLFEKVLFGGLLLISAGTQRHLPVWLIVTILIVTKLTYLFYKESSKNKLSTKKFNKVYKSFTISIVFICGILTTLTFSQTKQFSENLVYPKQALEFLKNYPIEGNLFAPYEWGGYLSWKLPSKRVFIDGRMPSWRWKAPLGESDWVFEEYQKIYEQNKYEEIFAKYNIKTVLLHTQKEMQKNFNPIINFLRESWDKLLTKNAQYKSLNEKLEEAGWRQVYKDSVVTLYQK